jgi:hypothetical protein
MKSTLLLLIAPVLLFVSGCKKEDPPKPDAAGSIVFWQTKTTSQTNLANGSTTYYFYIDGVYKSSRAVSEYWTSVPNCENQQAFKYSVMLKDGGSKTILVEIKDQDNDVLYNFATTLDYDVCYQQELQ